MAINTERIRNYLKTFNFEKLFVEELGWDRHKSSLDVQADNQIVTLEAIAHKRGMIVYTCQLSVPRLAVDDTIRKIETQVAKSVYEHLIIYTDANRTEQIWQWAKREQGKPIARRHHHYNVKQSGEPLIQKLLAIVFTIEEEEKLTIVDVSGRVGEAFDVEKVTKHFYDRFQKEHAGFLKFINGIPDADLHRWYASVMLNRLMFIYFIQKKGFLDGDINYLTSKLAQSKQQAKDRYYQDFLCPLFFEGFAKPQNERDKKLSQLLGNVPYLNGGIFQKHDIEKKHEKTIEVPDSAFEKIFEFFETYQWHLDERPLRNDYEINPDVLGYIFEKYINQKQMGAYYTKEDITGYISQNTVIPRIFDIAREKCKIAFEGGQSIWRLLKDNPDRYIYDAVKKGVNLPLPDNIALGLDRTKPNLLDRRNDWNKPAQTEYALPTEIWREVVTRRKRYEEVRTKLANGEIKSINDLITYNIDIRQFAQDVVENCEGPELLRAIWHTIVGRIPKKSNGKFEAGISILDPACGSGAFLFAALNILEPLYEACLERMQLFVDDLERSGQKHSPEKFSDFREILKEVSNRPSAKYFIYKTIIINNLFGVDIMEEAIEICKLRLFLKLVAQVDTVERIEPLPDIDFNIRAGNTLVGFANLDEVKRSMQGDFLKLKSLPVIEENAELADRAFQEFRLMQTREKMDPSKFANSKAEVKKRLKALEGELNGHLAGEYGIKEGTKHTKEKYSNWLKSHKPFHWFIDFYGIINNGGFDVTIGNPPYVEYSKVKKEYTIKNYKTEDCGNLYAYFLERCLDILRNKGRTGMIVQLPIVCTDRMQPLQNECLTRNTGLWFSNFDDRPARLFDGLQHIRASIIVTEKGLPVPKPVVHSTTYNRWYTEFRPLLFHVLSFTNNTKYILEGSIPKIGDSIAKSIRERIALFAQLSDYFSTTSQQLIYFHNSPQYWIRAMDFAPYFWNERDGEQVSSHIKFITIRNKEEAIVTTAILNSSAFYWHFISESNGRDLVLREIERFPVGIDKMSEPTKIALAKQIRLLMDDYRKHSLRKECEYKTTGRVAYDEFFPKYSKPIIDEIDKVLAKHYGFTEEELDFIINYDIKYRMGKNNEEEEQ